MGCCVQNAPANAEARTLANHRDYGDAAAVLTMVLEANLAIDLRVKRVVFPKSDVEAWLEATALLAHQNRTARDEIAVVALDAQPLRVAVAAVA